MTPAHADRGLKEIHRCEVCGGRDLRPAIDLGLHPLCDDLVPVGDPRTCLEYPIEILLCPGCATAHQRFQVPKERLFPPTYHYRSRFTADVLAGMASLVARCRELVGPLSGRLAVDIGCNDGSLLDEFARAGARGVGVEPTDAWRDADAKGHRVYGTYFTREVAARLVAEHGHPDVVTFTNVFAHIDDLDALLDALRLLVADRGLVVIENHYLGAVLESGQFDTFYHEHPRTYSATSFEHVARRLGRRIAAIEYPSRYGGNVRVFLSADEARAVPLEAAVRVREAAFDEAFATLRLRADRWRVAKRRQLADLVARHGPLRAKAFPGRAAILVKLLGVGTETIGAVYEKPGSMKIGHYVPGTRIPISSDEALFEPAARDAPLLNLAWHISAEIREYMKARGYAGDVIDVLAPGDFAGTP